MSNIENIKSNQHVYKEKCPILYSIDIIGQKWKIPIIWYLSEQQIARYNEIKRGVTGITNMMLTKSLQELEARKLVNRVQYNTIPPKVEYSLTKRGKSLVPVLEKLSEWGEEQIILDSNDLK